MSRTTVSVHARHATEAVVVYAAEPFLTVDLDVSGVHVQADGLELHMRPDAADSSYSRLFLSLDAARDLALQILELTEPADAPALSEVA